MSERNTWRARLLRGRYWLYAAIVLAILLFRVIPGLRSRVPAIRRMPTASVTNELAIAGLDIAPELIPRVVAFYQSLYPDLKLTTRPGGTVQALEDLLNHRADVAFLSRPPSAREDSVVHALRDSVLIFPVALAGTLVLAAGSAGLDSLSVRSLREVLNGGRPRELGLAGQGPVRVYVPDPRSGLWGAVTNQLGLSDTAAANVTWLQGDQDVARAVAQDPASIGLVSSLALPPEGESGCRAVRITADPGSAAVDPTEAEIAGGNYPLYHYLYASCLVRGGAQAAGFVSFLNGEQGQILIRREGFLPAREIAREIRLAQRPVGMPR